MEQVILACGRGGSIAKAIAQTAEQPFNHNYKETIVTWVGDGCVVVSDTNVPITDDIASALALVEQLAVTHEVDMAFESFSRRQRSCRNRRRNGGMR